MRKSILLKGLIAMLLISNCMLGSGCSVNEGQSAHEELNLVLAGMTGSDGVTFKGSTMLTKNGVSIPEAMIYFGGTMQEHKKLNIYTILPDHSRVIQKSPVRVKGVKSKVASMKSYYSQLEKRGGKWVAPSAVTSTTEENNPLLLLNPLQQLEALEFMEKKVSKERGAGRGTSVLRIELTPTEALEQLSAELINEMEGLRPNPVTSAGNPQETDKVAAQALTDLWVKRNNELQQNLKQASVETIYHLTVDKKHNLPRRLTLHRKVTYPGLQNELDKESYVSQVDFSEYR